MTKGPCWKLDWQVPATGPAAPKPMIPSRGGARAGANTSPPKSADAVILAATLTSSINDNVRGD